MPESLTELNEAVADVRDKKGRALDELTELAHTDNLTEGQKQRFDDLERAIEKYQTQYSSLSAKRNQALRDGVQSGEFTVEPASIWDLDRDPMRDPADVHRFRGNPWDA